MSCSLPEILRSVLLRYSISLTVKPSFPIGCTYRDSCIEVAGKFVKDLSELGRELSRVVTEDDNLIWNEVNYTIKMNLSLSLEDKLH